MAIRMPSPSEAAQKWSSVSAQRGQDYLKGVEGAGSAWQEGVNGAEATWADGVQQAISRGAYGDGVQGKGGKYVERARTLGAQRWTTGIQASGDAYQRGVAPIFNAIANVTLPPRMARGNPANYMRSQAVGEAARQAALQNM